MSEVKDEFPTDASDDFGYKSLGHPIQLVGDYDEQLPYKQISNLAYAPHAGLFAAAGASELVIGKLSDLKQDINDSKEEFTTGKHTVSLTDVNSVAFTKDERHLLVSTNNTILFAQLDPASYTSLSTASFKTITTGGSIEKIIGCPSSAIACAVLDEQSQLHTLQLPSGTLTAIASDVLDFSFSPKGKQIAIAKKDGTIRQITLDGTEKVTIERPEEVQEDDLLPLSVYWVSTHTFFASYGQEQEYDQDEDPSFDMKFFIIEHDKATNTNSFRENYDAVPAFGSVWRKQTVYASTLHNLSQALPSISFFASSTSADISALTPSDIIQTGDDSKRAALPLNDETGNDVNAIGLITDVKMKETVVEPCAGVSEAQWLPTVWVLGQNGKIQGWYVYHVHDLKNGSFSQTGPLAFENELFAATSGSAPAAASPAASPFGSTQNPSFGFGTSSAANPNSPFTAQPRFGSVPSNPDTEPKTGFGFGSATQTSSNTFGNGGFGSASNTATTPAFGSTGFGSSTTTAAPAFGSTGLGSSATAAAPSFGSTGFGSSDTKPTAPAFGATGFGSSATNATPGFGSSAFGAAKPAFGSTAFGSSSFGSKPADATSINSTGSAFSMGTGTTGSTAFSGFSTGGSNASPFGNLGGDKKDTSSPFTSLGGAKTETTASPFTSLGGANTTASPFTSLGGAKTETTASPFSAFGKSTETKDNASPFSMFGNSSDKKEATTSPFGAIGSNETNAPETGLFGKPPVNSPFTSLNDGKKTENAFSFGNAFGAKMEESETTTKEVNSKPTTGLFGTKPDAPAFSFGAKPPASAPLPGQNTLKTSGTMNFGSFLSGTEEQTTPLPQSDDDFGSDDENDSNSSDDEAPIPIKSPPSQAQPTSTTTAQGPTSFGAAAGPTSFGSTAASGFSGFGSSAFGNSGFKFGQKPAVATEGKSDGATLNVGDSGFGAFASKKTELGSKNIFEAAGEKKEDDIADEVKPFSDDEADAADDADDDDDDAPHVGDDELQTDPSDESQSEDEEHGDSEHDIPEDSFEGFEDTQDQTGVSEGYSDGFEDLSKAKGFDDGDDDDEESDEDENEDEDEIEVRDEMADMNIREEKEDPEVDEDLKESLEKELNLDEDYTPSESFKSVNEEDLYLEAQKLNPDGSVSGEDGAQNEDEDDLNCVTIVNRSTQSGPEYADVQVHAVPEVKSASVDATIPYASVSINTDPVEQTSINTQAFEGDEAYIGSFYLPSLIPRYVHLGDVRYPPLSNDDVARELEKIVYDTESELMIVEENIENLGQVIIDHMNPTVQHTEATLDHSEQWRLSEASTINSIIRSKLGPASSIHTTVDSQLKKLETLKESITTQCKRSTTLSDKVISLERSSDASTLAARDLPFDSQLLQTQVRSTYTTTANALREAEQRLLTLKTAANVAYDNAPTPETMHGIISHINSVTREYANDTKRLSDEIAKLNENHERILQGVQSGQSELFRKNVDKGSTLMKVDETQKRLNAQSALVDEFGGRLVMEISSKF